MERVAPPLTARTGDFWRSGADGVLRIARCDACTRFVHPPQPVCPNCRARGMTFAPVSGQGVVHSVTINRYAWFPGMVPPYAIAEIELAEQAGLRLLSTVVDVPPEDVRIGMAVTVRFEQVDDAFIPVFAPAGDPA